MNKGYVKIPRLTDRSLTGRAISVLEYICENVRINAPRETELGVEGIGEMLTTRSRLVKVFRTTAQKIRSDLKVLVEAGYIEMETSARYSKIRVIWQDFALLNGYDIMLNNQANNQANNQPTILVSSDVSVGCEDEKNKITNRITNRITNINNKDIYEDNNIHTQEYINLVKAKSAPAHTHTPNAHTASAIELLEWMTRTLPDLMEMERPLSLIGAEQLVKTYPVEVIHTLLLRAWSKGAHEKHRSTKVMFDSYAERLPQQAELKGLITYEQMCNEITKYGIPQKEFEMVPQPTGKALWRRIGIN